ncbi:MAG: hypothetical protein NWF04_01075 [Candidatus Bathyarchaeota archaeon]|nr:hypothetical protein [Candidatus Bathyarchaeota archaeon]
MKAKYLIPFLLIPLLLLSFLSTSALAFNLDLTITPSNQTYCGYSTATLNGTLHCNDLNVNDGIVGLQVQDSNQNTIITHSIKTGTKSPSPLPVHINSAYLSDMSANPQDSISAGTLGCFAVNIANNDNVGHTMLVTITVYDSAGIPVAHVFGTPSLVAGATGTALLSIQIPTGAHTGIAYGYANTYSGWPSEGGFPMGLEASFNFTITNGAPENVASFPQSNGSQGSYYHSFNLPLTGPDDCVYTVFASSSYCGENAFATAAFNVLFSDFTGDNAVTYADVDAFENAYIQYNTDHVFDSSFDLNGDGKLDFNDLFLFATCYVTANGSFT